ncbi:hypothetical protein B0H16DRAFT_331392 [Mycena metata]|uniref:Uncharacterized protein n=1 Tax=Mycena metata TaxID=1033252 RepID=A0AAD7HLZ6_9AGAR|nr:hypothetical protein B0H16DRAFT_331392 [Mycena metata]
MSAASELSRLARSGVWYTCTVARWESNKEVGKTLDAECVRIPKWNGPSLITVLSVLVLLQTALARGSLPLVTYLRNKPIISITRWSGGAVLDEFDITADCGETSKNRSHKRHIWLNSRHLAGSVEHLKVKSLRVFDCIIYKCLKYITSTDVHYSQRCGSSIAANNRLSRVARYPVNDHFGKSLKIKLVGHSKRH